ncbi:helix-turn-helix domain-containing protein [Modestobacter lapidis]|nr:helix-turn-helix domain-containing protein [Modestobacter lapidis]
MSDRRDYWLQTVCRNIFPVDFDPRLDVQPQAAMACTSVGALSMREVVGGNHVYVRDEDHVRRSDPESFQVGIPTRGSSMLIQDGREAQLDPGDMVLWDSSRPYTLVMAERFRWHVFLLPKQDLRRSAAELRCLTARPIRAGTGGVPDVVSHFLLDLAARGRQLEGDPSAAVLGEAAGDLIGTLIRSEFGMPWQVGKPEDVLRNRARHFIAEHHHDPALSPTLIAAAVGVSVRSLHQLFLGSDETVMDCVRGTRLAAIHADLADPRLAHRSIGRIAAMHGLPNATVFARMFKNEYDVTPREFRVAAALS